MRFLTVLTLVLQMIFVSVAVAEDGKAGCVGTLKIERLVSRALPDGHLALGGGFVNNSHHLDVGLPPEVSLPLDNPKYPVHSVIEFRFEPELDEPEEYRSRLCDAVEVALTASCDSVGRSTRLLTCSFRTESSYGKGTVDILPESEEASAFFVIVVANEW